MAVTEDAASDKSVTELFRAAEAGDQAAWNALIDRYTRLLWSVARGYRMREADAADVVQTSWLRLVEHFGRIEDPERLPGWLATTARRECLRILRRTGRELASGAVDSEWDLVDERAEPVDAGLLLHERDSALWECFQRLSVRCQVLLRVLTATPAPDYASVSAALGMPMGSIGPTRGRCLNQLRRLATEVGLVASGETRGA